MNRIVPIIVGTAAVLILLGATFLIARPAWAVGAFPYATGGTGTTTPNIGQLVWWGTANQKGIATTSVTCSGSTSCTSFTAIGSSPITITSSGGAGAAYPFTPGTFGSTNTSATSTAINDTAGFISTASSTLQFLSILLSTTTSATTTNFAITGAPAVNCNGTSALTTSAAGNITCTAQPQGTVTAVSIATANGFAGSSSGGATPALTLTTTVTGLTLGNGTALSAYGGGSCTFFIASLNGSGVPTCAGFAYPFVYATTFNTLSAGTSTPLWLQGSPFSLFASSTVVFTNATTTQEAEGRDIINAWNGRISPTRSFVLTTGTTTTWTGTTSQAYVPAIVTPFIGTLRQARCLASTTQAFLGVTVRINGTKVTPSYFVASTTIGQIKFTANNTFTAGQTIDMLVGTTTTDANAQSISCTYDTTETP